MHEKLFFRDSIQIKCICLLINRSSLIKHEGRRVSVAINIIITFFFFRNEVFQQLLNYNNMINF